MYDILYEEIKRELKKELKYIPPSLINYGYLILLYLKKQCDNNKLDYEKIIIEPDFKEVIKDITDIHIPEHIANLDSFHKLLQIIQNKDLKALADEFLEHNHTWGLNMFSKNQKYCIYINKDYITHNFNIYTPDKSIKYIGIDKPNSIFNILDKIYGIKHEYLDNTIPSENTIYYEDYSPIYSEYKENSITYRISKLIDKYQNKRIIIKTKYQKISTFDNQKIINKYLKHVIINTDNDKNEVMLIIGPKKEDYVNIILYNENKPISYLKKLIKDNIEVKEELIKVKNIDIINNRYRIGFNYYNKKDNNNKNNIKDIINENSAFINRVYEFNENIERELEKLIIK